jgi:hypothetical protein
MGDETEPGLGADVPTEVHDPAPQPQTPLAYSVAAAETVELTRSPWRVRLLIAGVILAVAGAVASVIMLAAWGRHERPSAALPPTTTTQPNPRPLQYDSRGVPMVPKDPTPKEQQQVLVATFDHAGIPYSNPVAAAIDADRVCRYLSSGHHTGSELLGWVHWTHPAFTNDQVGGFAGASVGIYCLQYAYLFDPTDVGATS